jgi:hypothetical protein
MEHGIKMFNEHIAIVEPFNLLDIINNFFNNKKLSIHYYVDWKNEEEIVKIANIEILGVYTLSNQDIRRSDVKTFWDKNDIPNDIYEELMKIVIESSKQIDKNSIPLPSKIK